MRRFSNESVRKAGKSVKLGACEPCKRVISREAMTVSQKHGSFSTSEIREAFKRASEKMKTA